MSMISEHLKAEIIDPTLPRDSFVPPVEDEDLEDPYLEDPDLIDVGGAGDDDVE